MTFNKVNSVAESGIFNFGLLLDDHFSSVLVEASQSFAEQKPLDYVLGENSLPHLTILQFPVGDAHYEDVWAKLNSITLPEIDIHCHGFGFDRFWIWDVLWLRIKHCAALRTVQNEAIRVLGPQDYVNGIGDMFEPHITLATWKRENRFPDFTIPEAILDRQNVATSYSLGISGPQFQYAKCLVRK